MENRQPKGFQFSEIRFSKIQDGGQHVKFQKSYYNSVVEWDYVTVKLKYRAQAKKPTSASKTSSYSHTLLKQQILYRKKTTALKQQKLN